MAREVSGELAKLVHWFSFPMLELSKPCEKTEREKEERILKKKNSQELITKNESFQSFSISLSLSLSRTASQLQTQFESLYLYRLREYSKAGFSRLAPFEERANSSDQKNILESDQIANNLSAWYAVAMV